MNIKEINKYSRLPTDQIPPVPGLTRKIQVFNTNILKRPIIYPLYKLILTVLIVFLIGLAASRLPGLILGSALTNNLSLVTNPSFVPTDSGLLRSNTAVVEGEVKQISGDKITIKAGEDEIVVKLSSQFALPGTPELSTATDSSGLRTPPRRTLTEFKVGDKVRVFLEVIGEETLVTNITVR